MKVHGAVGTHIGAAWGPEPRVRWLCVVAQRHVAQRGVLVRHEIGRTVGGVHPAEARLDPRTSG